MSEILSALINSRDNSKICWVGWGLIFRFVCFSKIKIQLTRRTVLFLLVYPDHSPLMTTLEHPRVQGYKGVGGWVYVLLLLIFRFVCFWKIKTQLTRKKNFQLSPRGLYPEHWEKSYLVELQGYFANCKLPPEHHNVRICKNTPLPFSLLMKYSNWKGAVLLWFGTSTSRWGPTTNESSCSDKLPSLTFQS